MTTFLECTIKEFPQIAFSYDHIIHKKIHNPNIIVMAIPKGKRGVLWIYNNTLYIFEIQQHNKLSKIMQFTKNIQQPNIFFKNSGTVLYGTFFTMQKYSFFCLENILYTNNKQNLNTNIFQLNTLLENNIFEPFIDHVKVGLPYMCNNFHELVKYITTLNYPIEFIRFDYGTKTSYLKYFKPKVRNIANISNPRRIFTIKADTSTPDTYFLYDDKTNEYHSVAYIPSYKLSVWLNSIFRRIKENNNIDLLEESDSEEEFENPSVLKYMNNDNIGGKQMICEYNNKFDKWTPIISE